MSSKSKTRFADVLKKYENELLEDWTKHQVQAIGRSGRLREGELKEHCHSFLRALQDAARNGEGNPASEGWAEVREMLARASASRAEQGFGPSETATFIFSFKRPLFAALQRELADDRDALLEETWKASEVLDRLGLFTTELWQTNREKVILRQQQDMLELSTPVVKLWDGILALPLIGTLDSARAQLVTESLLQSVVEWVAEIAIIDITGVPTVDTLVAQHLLKTVTATRLMGAECIISGIRPQIAQTIVHLGVDLGDIMTKATLADAFALALRRRGLTVSKATVAK